MAKTTTNIDLIKQAVLSKQGNQRQANSAVKTRGMVSGGGRKPHKQKGTGKARAGSTRSPIWVGGGKVFGPTKEENYKTRLPKKMQRAAFLELLKVRKDSIKSVDSLAMKEMKTKAALKLLKDNGVDNQFVLMVTEQIQPELIVSTNNLKNVSVITAQDFSINHLIDTSAILMEKAVFEKYFPAIKPEIKKPAVKKTAEKKDK